MRPDAHRTTAVDAVMRWCGLATMAGGALLILFYAVLVVRQAVDWQAGPTLGTPIHRPLMRTISAALVLLIVGLLGLLTARIDGLGWMPRAGGLVTLGGFGVWAYAAAENFLPISEPSWWHPLLFPALVAVGSLAFGLGVFRSRALPRGAAALVAVFGVLGITLLTDLDLGDWSSSPNYALVRMAGFTAMLLYGGGWVWLGTACGGQSRRAEQARALGLAAPQSAACRSAVVPEAVCVDVHRHGQSRCLRLDRLYQTTVGEHRRVNPMRQLAQVLQRLARIRLQFGQRGRGQTRIARELISDAGDIPGIARGDAAACAFPAASCEERHRQAGVDVEAVSRR